MKKRTKITLRTKIYLTIVALLALTGVFYAQFPPSHPVPFSGQVPFPTGVAAAPDLLLVAEYCSENIDQLDCNGTASLFARTPGFGSCREKYLAIAPSQSAAAGFTPRDVFVTEGAFVFKVHNGNVTLFTTLQGCIASDHNGITFDHFGTFGNDMIVTCQEGDVFRIHGDGTGNTAPIASTGVGEVEGPAVVPPGFGPHGGEIWVADEENNAVHAIRNTNPPNNGPYTVFLNILSHVNTEGVFVIPSPPCTFNPGGCQQGQGNGAFFLAEQQMFQLVWKYPLSDFTLPPPGLGGNVILTSESGADFADTSIVTFNGTNYVQTSFAPRIPGVNEGGSFVDCDVPTATPTPTPTATFTPTPTATATFTPTPTATFTPTPTATFTPTATATATATPTAFASCPEDPNARLTRAVDDTGTPHGSLPVYTTVQAAYNAAQNGDVIGMFSQTSENLTLGGAKTLTITQCTVAKVTAQSNSQPVWNITSTGALTIIGPDAVGGTVGWQLATNGHTIKSVRSTGAAQYGILVLGNSNSVSINSVSGSPVGIRITGNANDLRPGGTLSANSGNGVEIGSTATGNTVRIGNIQSNGGNGIQVDGSGNTVTSNGRVDNNTLNGILVNGSNNTIKNNAAGSDSGKGNGGAGIKVGGGGNTLDGNKANANGGVGFDLLSAGNKLKNNQSNQSSDGGSKENSGCEYRFSDNTTQDQGSNKKNNTSFVGGLSGPKYAAGCYE